jgi:hypothetical protein
MAAIEMKNIVKQYGDGFPAVNDVSIDVEVVDCAHASVELLRHVLERDRAHQPSSGSWNNGRSAGQCDDVA